MNMIIVTRKNDGAKIYLNPQNICAIYPHWEDTSRTIVLLANGGYVETREDAEAVARIVTMEG